MGRLHEGGRKPGGDWVKIMGALEGALKGWSGIGRRGKRGDFKVCQPQCNGQGLLKANICL